MKRLMAWVDMVGRGIRALVAGKAVETELDAEIGYHLDMLRQQYEDRGMSPEEALRAARREFGGIDQVKETIRGRQSFRWLDDLGRDTALAIRGIRKRPGYALLVILTLGLGIGANTSIFSIVNTVLLKPLPNEAGDRLVHVVQSAPGINQPSLSFAVHEVEQFRAQTRTLESVVEFHGMTFNLIGEGEPEEVNTGVVSWDYFQAMGMEPVLGRGFTPDEEAGVGGRVLVFSHEYWRDRFGSDPSVVGREFEMNDEIHTVIGVLPPAARYPAGFDVYMPVSHCPIRSSDGFIANRNARMMTVMGRMHPGASLTEVQTEMNTIAARLSSTSPEVYRQQETGYTASATMMKEELVQAARPTLIVLMVATGFVLLIACANVANLMLARLDRRSQEMSVRTALGARRGRLIRQLLTEGVVLASLGGIVGLFVAYGGLELLRGFAMRFTPRAEEVRIDVWVLAFTAFISLGTGLLFGVLPALRPQEEPGQSLRKAGVKTATPGRGLARSVLVVAQVAASFVLLTGAGLLARSFVKLQSVDAGYQAENVLTARVSFPTQGRYLPWEAQDQLFTEVLTELERLPGVSSAAVGNLIPLSGGFAFGRQYQIEGQPRDPGDNIQAFLRVTTDEYFETLGIPLLTGRTFIRDDVREGEGVAVINQTFAEAHFPNSDPVGQRLLQCGQTECDPESARTIVGVVGDVRFRGLEQEAGPEVYMRAQQSGFYGRTIVVRNHASGLELNRAVTEIVHRIDPELPVVDVQTLDQVRADSMAPRRLTLTLMGVFAAAALLVTLAGVFGLMAYVVSERKRELAIRMAFGAQQRGIVGMIVRQAGVLIGVGLAVGLVVSPFLSRALSSLLWGVGATDVWTLAGVAALLAATGLVACYLPARQAASVSPAVPLRSD
ncbi:MAG: ADOP family duplicated permease [Longimicrobiales bacterium]